MKQNHLFASVVILTALMVTSCDFGNKRSGVSSASTEISADSLEVYVTQYVKTVDALNTLAEIAKRGNTEFLETEYASLSKDLNQRKELAEKYEDQLPDNLEADKVKADREYKIASDIIQKVLEQE
ncbi:MAG: hypothetical protein ACK5MK_02680 [Dysgonomonas sp.]